MRFAVPLLIGSVLSLAIISEGTYRRAESTLTGGIKLTDARIAAARLLQLLTDAETAQRGYLLTDNSDYIEPLRNAKREVNASGAFFEYLSALGPAGPADAEKIRKAVTAKFDELDHTIAMAQAGDRTQAVSLVQTDAGKRLMDELRLLLKNKLEEAALLQQDARGNIYEALLFNRIAVLVLSCVLALGLYLHMLRSRIIQRSRAEYQQTLEKEVAEKTAGLRTLHAWLETAREDEKSHLARELHDELGGILTTAKMTITRMRGKLAGDPTLIEHIDSVSQRLNEGVALKRRVIEDLRPSALHLLGLQVALVNLCDEATKQFGIAITAEIAEVQLGKNEQLALFRIVQEALTNVGKHSRATQVGVHLEQAGDEILLKIADNGVGFDPATVKVASHGLTGMRFRMESLGGSFSVVSSAGNGLTLCAKLPKQSSETTALPGSEQPMAA